MYLTFFKNRVDFYTIIFSRNQNLHKDDQHTHFKIIMVKKNRALDFKIIPDSITLFNEN